MTSGIDPLILWLAWREPPVDRRGKRTTINWHGLMPQAKPTLKGVPEYYNPGVWYSAVYTSILERHSHGHKGESSSA
jgi:hypothetical protein